MLKRQHLTGVLVLLSLVAGTAMASAQTPANRRKRFPQRAGINIGRLPPLHRASLVGET